VLRTSISKSFIHRSLRPLLGWTQATPKSGFLDPAWDRSSPIWPGMVAMKTTGTNFTLINGTGVPHGLFGLYIGGDGIDEPLDSGINAISVWVLDPDAEFQVLAPAFDTSATWTDPGDGTELQIFARTVATAPSPAVYNPAANTFPTGYRGQLVPAGATNASTQPVARLISVDSASQITIGGLRLK
jgi:hypothetical protein